MNFNTFKEMIFFYSFVCKIDFERENKKTYT